MDKKSENRFSMQLGVTNYQQEQSAVFSPLPGYAPLLVQLLANNAEIATVGQVQLTNRTGLTEQKTTYRLALAGITFKVGNLIESYAKMNENHVLANEVHMSQSILLKVADTVLYEHASSILATANEHITELATYGVTNDMVDELEAAISTFFGFIPKPAAGKSLSKQATKRVKELLDENDAILEKVDLLSQIFRFTNPEAYGNYHNLRHVAETGKRYIAFKALVTDATTNLPLSNVLFRFGPKPGTTYPVGVPVPVPLTKKTAEKGGFQIKNMIAGDYQVEVSKNSYQPQSLTAYVTDGEMTTLNVALVPNAS